jgi:transposase
VTNRLAESVARMCQLMAVKHVAGCFHLGWDKVNGIEKRWLVKTPGPIDLRGVQMNASSFMPVQGRSGQEIVLASFIGASLQ